MSEGSLRAQLSPQMLTADGKVLRLDAGVLAFGRAGVFAFGRSVGVPRLLGVSLAGGAAAPRPLRRVGKFLQIKSLEGLKSRESFAVRRCFVHIILTQAASLESLSNAHSLFDLQQMS